MNNNLDALIIGKYSDALETYLKTALTGEDVVSALGAFDDTLLSQRLSQALSNTMQTRGLTEEKANLVNEALGLL